MVYSWSFTPRDPITVSPDGDNLLIEGVQLSSGVKIAVKLAPLTLDDEAFIQNLGAGSSNDADIKLICHICVKWGDQDFVLPQDLQGELKAVRDISGVIQRYFPQRAEIIEKSQSSTGSTVSPKRK